jgi:hypothetical protein
MPKCTQGKIDLGRVGRRVIEADFSGGDLSSEGGVVSLRQLDERLGLTRAAALALGDERRGASAEHSVRDMVAQRIFGLCMGWSDVCDHNTLRQDLLMQTAVGRAQVLASAPTLSRLETAASPAQARALHEVLMRQFIAGHRRAPREIVLDLDATHVPLHGQQERGFFHAYYDNYCDLPLYVFSGQDLLACVLRPSDRDPASVACALVWRLVQALRRAWPRVRIVVRADSGFCRPRLLRRLERWGVHYVLGLQKNSRLHQRVELAELALAEQYQRRGRKQRLFGKFEYAADTRDKPRRVIARLEHGEQGANPRFIVTDLSGQCSGAVRAALLRARRSREPHQAGAARSVRAPRQLPSLLGQPAAAVAGGTGLHADGAAAPPSPARHAAGLCLHRHHPGAAAQDRRGRLAQHAPCARDAGKRSSQKRQLTARLRWKRGAPQRLAVTTDLTRRVRPLRTRSSRPRPRWRRCESSRWHTPSLRFAPCQRGR